MGGGLPKGNISARVANHLFRNSLATEAIQDCKSGRVGSIVLVGHSLGASAAVSMAEQLQQAGLHVALMVTFDPVVRTALPDNVRLLRNFYISNVVGTAVWLGQHFHALLQHAPLNPNSAHAHAS